MEVHKPTTIRHFEGHARTEPVVIDSTIMQTYKTCPKKYFFSYVLGYRQQGTQPFFVFGGAYHKFREILELKYTFESKTADEAFGLAAMEGLRYYEKHAVGTDFTRYEYLDKRRLIDSFSVTYKHWLTEKKIGAYRVLSVEQALAVVTEWGTIIAGRADQIVEFRGQPWGRDWKTSSQGGYQFSRGLAPNDQFTRYTWLESQIIQRPVMGQVVEVLQNTKTVGPKLEVYTTTRSKVEIDAWLEDHKFWEAQIKFSRDNDHYPRNEKGCFFCEFHKICSKTSNPKAEFAMLKSNFVVSPWNCMETAE